MNEEPNEVKAIYVAPGESEEYSVIDESTKAEATCQVYDPAQLSRLEEMLY